jgi:hypothetical protein
MRNRLPLTIIVVVTLLIGGPLSLDSWLSKKDAHYDEVVGRHECDGDVCEADFNGDGTPGRLERSKASLTTQDRWLIAIDSGQELLRLPYKHIDGSLQTHAALRNESGKARLLIFDGTEGGAPVQAVFEWDGQKMSQVTPSDADHQILSALAARDDAGTWTDWGIYRAFSLPLLLGYYSLLIGIVIGVLLCHRFRSAIEGLR